MSVWSFFQLYSELHPITSPDVEVLMPLYLNLWLQWGVMSLTVWLSRECALAVTWLASSWKAGIKIQVPTRERLYEDAGWKKPSMCQAERLEKTQILSLQNHEWIIFCCLRYLEASVCDIFYSSRTREYIFHPNLNSNPLFSTKLFLTALLCQLSHSCLDFMSIYFL